MSPPRLLHSRQISLYRVYYVYMASHVLAAGVRAGPAQQWPCSDAAACPPPALSCHNSACHSAGRRPGDNVPGRYIVMFDNAQVQDVQAGISRYVIATEFNCLRDVQPPTCVQPQQTCMCLAAAAPNECCHRVPRRRSLRPAFRAPDARGAAAASSQLPFDVVSTFGALAAPADATGDETAVGGQRRLLAEQRRRRRRLPVGFAMSVRCLKLPALSTQPATPSPPHTPQPYTHPIHTYTTVSVAAERRCQLTMQVRQSRNAFVKWVP